MTEQKKIIFEIPPQSTTQETQDYVNKSVKDRLDLHQNLIYVVLIVVAMGFLAIVVTSLYQFADISRYKADRYGEYSQQLKVLQSELDAQKMQSGKK